MPNAMFYEYGDYITPAGKFYSVYPTGNKLSSLYPKEYINAEKPEGSWYITPKLN